MNGLRGKLSLGPVLQHWHNRFFGHDEPARILDRKFRIVQHYDFGLYHLLTQADVPMFASFVGYGTNALNDPTYDRLDRAWFERFETLADQVRIGGMPAFGPIQVWALRREQGPTPPASR